MNKLKTAIRIVAQELKRRIEITKQELAMLEDELESELFVLEICGADEYRIGVDGGPCGV